MTNRADESATDGSSGESPPIAPAPNGSARSRSPESALPESGQAWRDRLTPRPTPLGVLIVAAAFAFVCGFAVHPQALVPAYCLTAAIVVGSLWPWINLRGLSAEYDFPSDRAWEGETLTVRLRLRNRRPWPIEGIVLSCDDLPDAPPHLCERIPPRGRLEIAWKVTPAVRGRFPRQGITIATSFPFGLREFRRTIACAAPLLVWPRRLTPTNLAPLVEGAPHPSGGSYGNRAGNEGETTGVRAFRLGDSLRQVHWNRTAQCDELMVRERQAVAAPPWRIVLDGAAETHLGRGPDSTLEWSVRIVAALLETAAAKGVPAEAILPGLRLKWGGRRGDLRRLRDALAEWTAPADAAADAGTDKSAAYPGVRTSAPVAEWVVTTDLRRETDGLFAARPGRIRLILSSAGFGAAAVSSLAVTSPAGSGPAELRPGGNVSPVASVGASPPSRRLPTWQVPVRIESPKFVEARLAGPEWGPR